MPCEPGKNTQPHPPHVHAVGFRAAAPVTPGSSNQHLCIDDTKSCMCFGMGFISDRAKPALRKVDATGCWRYPWAGTHILAELECVEGVRPSGGA